MALRVLLLSAALAATVLPSNAFVGTPLPMLASPASRLQLSRAQPRAASLSRTTMTLSAKPAEKKIGKLARLQKTTFAAVVAVMMLMGAPSASNAEMNRKSTGSAGGGFHKPAPTQTASTGSHTAMKGVASPSVADTKATPQKAAPTKSVATTIKEGADGSKTKVTTTTTTDADGKKHVTSEKTIIRQGNNNNAAAAPAGGAAAAAAPAKEIHVIHGGGAPAMSGSGMVAAAAGAAVGAAAMSAMAPPTPWYNPMGWGMPGMGMGQPMMAPMATPFGVAIGMKTAILTSLFLGLGITIALVFLFRR